MTEITSPSGRLLQLLALLQTRREWSGTELAERLRVTGRTVRRDVDRLRELGYPVNASVGVGGGYQLGAGAEMPPLLLDDDEALAVAFGLQAGATGPVLGIGEPSLRALTKLRQVMPSRLRHRLDALAVDVVEPAPARSAVEAKVLAAVAAVCHNHERLRFDYQKRNGEQSRRETEPHRVVRSGARWYLVAWDLSRAGWRSFRVDRMTLKIPTGPRFTPRELPPGGAAAFVTRGISEAYQQAQARVLLHAPLAQIDPMMQGDWGVIESSGDDTCVVTLRGASLQSIARWLNAFDEDFTVLEPAGLREECAGLAARHEMLARRYRAA